MKFGRCSFQSRPLASAQRSIGTIAEQSGEAFKLGLPDEEEPPEQPLGTGGAWLAGTALIKSNAASTQQRLAAPRLLIGGAVRVAF
jgi:hypothetical protein